MDIEKALKTGFERTKAKSGLQLVGVYFVINLISTVAAQSSAQRSLERMQGMGGTEQLPPFLQDSLMTDPGPLAFDLPSSLIWLMNIGSSVAFVVVAIAAYRVFASDIRDRIPEEAYKRNIGMTTLNAIIAGIIFVVLVAIGFVLLIIPGVYLLVTLVFFLPFVALEDESFIDSIKSSWELTKGRRMSVFLLFVAYVVVAIVVGIVGGIASAVVGAVLPILGGLVTVAVSSAVNVYGLAVLYDAYEQLRDSGGSAVEPSPEETGAEGTPA